MYESVKVSDLMSISYINTVCSTDDNNVTFMSHPSLLRRLLEASRMNLALFILFQKKTEGITPDPEERRGSSGGVVVPSSNWSSRYGKDKPVLSPLAN